MNKPTQPPILVGPLQQPQQRTGGTVYINFFDQIDVPRAKFLMATCTHLLQQRKPDTLYFLFASEGGHVGAGISLYNFLKGLPVNVVMHNTGNIDSIATVVYMAGKERYAAPGTSFHFHGVASMAQAGMRVTHSTLSELMSHMKEDENKIATIVSRNTTLSVEELQRLFVHGESKNLDFAMEKGIIKEVREVSIPRNAELISFDLRDGGGQIPIRQVPGEALRKVV